MTTNTTAEDVNNSSYLAAPCANSLTRSGALAPLVPEAPPALRPPSLLTLLPRLRDRRLDDEGLWDSLASVAAPAGVPSAFRERCTGIRDRRPVDDGLLGALDELPVPRSRLPLRLLLRRRWPSLVPCSPEWLRWLRWLWWLRWL